MKTVRLLTVGNSFANNALTFLEDIARSAGAAEFVVRRANLGGCSLEKHWNLSEYTARVPDYKTYQDTGPDGEKREGSLQEALKADSWDIVTLQQVSLESWLPETFEPYLGRLTARVRELAPGAAVALHQTWAYRADSTYFPEHNITQRRMFEGIRDTYAHYAGKYDCHVLPSGEAVQAVREEPGRSFVWPEPGFDHQKAVAPELPRQENSLAVGWIWQINSTWRGIPALHNDPTHLNSRGCYLIGCVWYERMTGFDVREATFVPTGMEPEDAVWLRDKAHEVCGRYPAIG